MSEAVTIKGPNLTEARVTDATQEETRALEGHLAGLKHSYKGWRNVVVWATLPEQHQMMEGDLKVGLEILDLVQEEPQCLLTAMEEDTSQRGTF